MSYIGTQPNNVKKNIGLYTPNDITALTKEGHWGGSLEFIATGTISSGNTLNFTSLKETKYDVHMLQAKNCESSSANTSLSVRLSNDGGSSYEAGSSYQLSLYYGTASGSFGEVYNAGTSYMQFMSDTANNNRGGCMYLYNLGSSNKSFSTYQQMEETSMSFGVSVYDTAETINAIQVLTTNTNAWTGTVGLYGIKQI